MSALRVERDGAVLRVTLARPERRNAFDAALIAELTEAFADVGEARAVVLAGEGPSFCAGADVEWQRSSIDLTYDENVADALRLYRMLDRVNGCPAPVVARVHGHAVGLGCNFALACDIVVASEQAVFAEAFVKIGLMPDGGGTYLLPRLVGYQKAFELMATGDAVTAAEALRLGLVNRVVPFAELDATVDALAARLAASPRVALAKMKAALNRDALNGREGESALAAALEFEAINQAVCARSPDFLEGVSAFVQKRRPVFGRGDERG